VEAELTFETCRFNLSEEGEHFINPCCFGEDLGAWMAAELRNVGYEVREPGQEDWGWYLLPEREGKKYFVAINGLSSEDQANPNQGEWRIVVQKRRGLLQRLLNKNNLTEAERIVADLRRILESQADLGRVECSYL
jgi:hypothetical protein